MKWTHISVVARHLIPSLVVAGVCLLEGFAIHSATANPIVNRVEELKKKADANGDGKLSGEEKKEMRNLVAESIGKRNPEQTVPEEEPAEEGEMVESEPVTAFSQGANCLFIGHSFFVPVARSFDEVANAGGFPRHKARTVFSPGPSGSPSQLWKNDLKKKTIESILASGEIELFGMTTIFGSEGTLDDYRNWIDLALQYNPETKIMIGQFWMAGGPLLENEIFEDLTEMIGARGFEEVEALRPEYPDRIFYVHYGHVGPLMKNEFSAGNLPDITRLAGLGREALFKDSRIGHAGPLMHELCALTWVAQLYRPDLGGVTHSDFSAQAAEIVRKSIEHNQQFR